MCPSDTLGQAGILDTGGENTSTFYNMEKATVHGKP
jgi:hypothetical protein